MKTSYSQEKYSWLVLLYSDFSDNIALDTFRYQYFAKTVTRSELNLVDLCRTPRFALDLPTKFNLVTVGRKIHKNLGGGDKTGLTLTTLSLIHI